MAVDKLREVMFEAIDLVREQALANVRENIRKNASKYPHQKRTGILEMSIKSFRGKSNTIARAYTKAKSKGLANHAHLVEFGHRISHVKLRRIKKLSERLASWKRWAPAYPFFRPALKSMRPKMRAILRAGVQRLMRGGFSQTAYARQENFGPDETGWVG